MGCESLEHLGNHEGHTLGIAKYDKIIKIECLTCQEVVLTIEEGGDKKLRIISESESKKANGERYRYEVKEIRRRGVDSSPVFKIDYVDCVDLENGLLPTPYETRDKAQDVIDKLVEVDAKNVKNNDKVVK